MPEFEVTLHGAGQTVTGSCYEVHFGRSRVLVDCGMFQGSRTLEELNNADFAFDIKAIDAVILTHAHIDHSGLVPKLVAQGYAGPIWCTVETADLLAFMLMDAARIQEHDVARRNRRADRADEPPVEPIYGVVDAERALKLLRTVTTDENFEPAPDLWARLWNAGHVLGSASVELGGGAARLLFSGDIGPDEKSFQANPQGPVGVDHVFCESTYGDRERADLSLLERRALLLREVTEALARGGNLVIPVFALERTQELLLDLAHLINAGDLRGANVFIDSPLATQITSVFAKYSDELADTDDADIFHHPAFHFTGSRRASEKISEMRGAIILAASGMCEGGRIRFHLLDNLPDARSTVLFVGFQAQGTLGRIIMEGARRVRISGNDVAVRAKIRSIDSYSAHADRSELLAWVRARQPISGSLFLTHGERESVLTLKADLDAEVASIFTPDIGETYVLPPATPAKLIDTRRASLPPVHGRDWQNDYADFAVSLRQELKAIGDAEKRRQAIAQMREVLQGFQSARAAQSLARHQRPRD
jgi:metallo-beta-lactamase family protein